MAARRRRRAGRGGTQARTRQAARARVTRRPEPARQPARKPGPASRTPTRCVLLLVSGPDPPVFLTTRWSRNGYTPSRRRDQRELINRFSLCFRCAKLEEEYRTYQFELVWHSMLGRFGTVSTSCISLLCLLSFSYVPYALSYEDINAPGAYERMIGCTPLTAFAIYHLLTSAHTGNQSSVDARRYCNFFIHGFGMELNNCGVFSCPFHQ